MKSTRRWMIPSLRGAAAGAATSLLTDGAGSELQDGGAGFWHLGLELDWTVLVDGATSFLEW